MTDPLSRRRLGRPLVRLVATDHASDGAEGRHAAVVRRIRPGEMIMVGDGRGRAYAGSSGRRSRDRSVEVTEHSPRPSRGRRIVAVQALAKGDRSELAVEMLTEIGVDEIVPWQAARSVVRWSGERAAKSWRAGGPRRARRPSSRGGSGCPSVAEA